MGARPSEVKFLTTAMTIGFSAMAFAFYKQRTVLNRFGYDLYLTQSNVDNADLLAVLQPNGTLRPGPASVAAKNLAKQLADWRKKGENRDHWHNSTGRDNRFLILKNVVPGNPPTEQYYMYAQGRDGVYQLHRINDPENVLQGMDYEGGPFREGVFTQIQRDINVSNSLIRHAASLNQHIAGEQQVNPSLVARWLENNKQAMNLCAVAAVSTKLFQVGAQASQSFLSSKTYQVMQGNKNLLEAARSEFEPIANKMNWKCK